MCNDRVIIRNIKTGVPFLFRYLINRYHMHIIYYCYFYLDLSNETPPDQATGAEVFDSDRAYVMFSHIASNRKIRIFTFFCLDKICVVSLLYSIYLYHTFFTVGRIADWKEHRQITKY